MIIESLEFNPKELSIADIRTLAEEEVARVTAIPAHVLGLSYEASRPKVEHDLSVRCVQMEDATE